MEIGLVSQQSSLPSAQNALVEKQSKPGESREDTACFLYYYREKKRKKESREALNQTGPETESTGPGQLPLGTAKRRRKNKSREKDSEEKEEQRKI